MRNTRVKKFKALRDQYRKNSSYFFSNSLEDYALNKDNEKYAKAKQELLFLKNQNKLIYVDIKHKKKALEEQLKSDYTIVDFIANNKNFKKYLNDVRKKRFEVQNKNFSVYSNVIKKENI